VKNIKKEGIMTSKEFIDSGILEQYVFGIASANEIEDVEKIIATDPAIYAEFMAISKSMENYAHEKSIKPSEVIKPFLMATINYTERMQNGEPFSNPPLLNEQSTVNDYGEWLNREDMVSPGTEDLFARIIGYTPQAVTAIVWIKDYAPHEVHDDEYERFLIVEGTCNIIVDEEVNHLVPGDYFAIPLFKNHMVKVTSLMPCKVILQRVAA
jgi:mannose-6-phosphate isomerase-like protein (cupin superfamily)